MDIDKYIKWLDNWDGCCNNNEEYLRMFIEVFHELKTYEAKQIFSKWKNKQ